VGRRPSAAIEELSRLDSRIVVTGTVDDVRPYLWGSKASIVPLRIGGGTRLKIYESMAAGLPCISTTIGAEGLEIHPPDDIRIADESEDFAEQCLVLLESPETARRVADAGLNLVRTKFSWERVTDLFEEAAGIGGGSGV
jgi:glycosyltransferase involved in cell wall biosynthesis